MNVNDLILFITEDKNALEDRNGLTPFFSLAQKIKQDKDGEQSKEITRLITEIDLSQLDTDDLNTLNAFIYHSGIKTEDILTTYRNYLDKVNGRKEKDVIKKGMILRFIIDCNKEIFSVDKILAESVLKKVAPWIWIDCISSYDWDATDSFITEMIKSDREVFKNLLIRIPSFKKKATGEEKLRESLLTWYCSMKEDREELKFWAAKFGIPIRENDIAKRESDIAICESEKRFAQIPLGQKIILKERLSYETAV